MPHQLLPYQLFGALFPSEFPSLVYKGIFKEDVIEKLIRCKVFRLSGRYDTSFLCACVCVLCVCVCVFVRGEGRFASVCMHTVGECFQSVRSWSHTLGF